MAGKLAATAWLSARGLRPTATRWDVVVGLGTASKSAALELDADRDTRFQLYIYSEEWGFQFAHAGRQSWIRVTDIPFVHGADAFKLLPHTPPLKSIGALLRQLETAHGIKFERQHAAISSTIHGAEPAVRKWLLTL